MADPKPEIIARWVIDEGVEIDYKPLKNVIWETLKNHLPNKSEEELWDLTEKNETSVLNEISVVASDYSEDGIESNFKLEYEGSSSYIAFINRPELALLNTLRTDSPNNFEFFCKDLLEKLGAVAIVEGGPYDKGIDFVGFDLPIGRMLGPQSKGARLLVIGQAKRYDEKNLISETDIRIFVGSATRKLNELKRTHHGKIGALHPTLLAFWTTSDFHKNAKEMAKELGIWYLSGLALTQLALRVDIAYKAHIQSTN